MTFAEHLARIADGVQTGDGAMVAGAFTEDGAYHDVFYGTFRGRPAIAEMVEERFHRDGADFRWEMIDPVESGGRGYARYLFSYASRLPEAAGRRALFEGVVVAKLRDGLIEDYDEVANAAVGLSLMGFDDARLAKFVRRQAEALSARPEAAAHRLPGSD